MNMDHCGAFEDGCWQFVTGRCSCTCCPPAPPHSDPPKKIESDTVTIKRLSKELGEAKATIFLLTRKLVNLEAELAAAPVGGGYTGDCRACDIEDELGTEEIPHPVDSRIHSCVPLAVTEEK
jgi:hypothetical protein